MITFWKANKWLLLTVLLVNSLDAVMVSISPHTWWKTTFFAVVLVLTNVFLCTASYFAGSSYQLRRNIRDNEALRHAFEDAMRRTGRISVLQDVSYVRDEDKQ